MGKSLAGKVCLNLSLQLVVHTNAISSVANLLYPNLNLVIVDVKIWLFLQLQDNKTFHTADNKVSGFELYSMFANVYFSYKRIRHDNK